MKRVRPRPVRGLPRVSVVIPCYNYGRFLPECVRSVLSQEGVDVDVLIVDDASPDGSAEVAVRLTGADSRVRVLAHEVNRGHIATYNEGLVAVDGEFVVLLSADDLLTPGSLARSAALLQAHPEVGFVYGFSPPFSDTPPRPRTAVHSWTVWPGHEWIEHICRRVSNPVATPEVVMRASLMRELVGYDARVPHAADLLLWLRAAARTQVGRINGADQAFYRRHGANMHVEMFAGVYVDILERRRTFDILFTEDGAYFPAGHRMRETALRGLAREALVTVCQSYGTSGARDGEFRERLLSIAAELSPRVQNERLWRASERRAARGAVLPRQVTAAVDDLRGRVRWRRWRRSGLIGAVR